MEKVFVNVLKRTEEGNYETESIHICKEIHIVGNVLFLYYEKKEHDTLYYDREKYHIEIKMDIPF